MAAIVPQAFYLGPEVDTYRKVGAGEPIAITSIGSHENASDTHDQLEYSSLVSVETVASLRQLGGLFRREVGPQHQSEYEAILRRPRSRGSSAELRIRVPDILNRRFQRDVGG